MEASRNVIGLVGSPNPDGRTSQLVSAALEGAAQAGVATELIQIFSDDGYAGHRAASRNAV